MQQMIILTDSFFEQIKFIDEIVSDLNYIINFNIFFYFKIILFFIYRLCFIFTNLYRILWNKYIDN